MADTISPRRRQYALATVEQTNEQTEGHHRRVKPPLRKTSYCAVDNRQSMSTCVVMNLNKTLAHIGVDGVIELRLLRSDQRAAKRFWVPRGAINQNARKHSGGRGDPARGAYSAPRPTQLVDRGSPPSSPWIQFPALSLMRQAKVLRVTLSPFPYWKIPSTPLNIKVYFTGHLLSNFVCPTVSCETGCNCFRLNIVIAGMCGIFFKIFVRFLFGFWKKTRIRSRMNWVRFGSVQKTQFCSDIIVIYCLCNSRVANLQQILQRQWMTWLWRHSQQRQQVI